MHDPATVGKQNPKLIALVPGTSCNLRNWRPKRFYFKTRGGRTASTASANVKGRDYYVVIRPSAGQWPARIPPPHSAGPASHVRLFSAAKSLFHQPCDSSTKHGSPDRVVRPPARRQPLSRSPRGRLLQRKPPTPLTADSPSSPGRDRVARRLRPAGRRPSRILSAPERAPARALCCGLSAAGAPALPSATRTAGGDAAAAAGMTMMAGLPRAARPRGQGVGSCRGVGRRLVRVGRGRGTHRRVVHVNRHVHCVVALSGGGGGGGGRAGGGHDSARGDELHAGRGGGAAGGRRPEGGGRRAAASRSRRAGRPAAIRPAGRRRIGAGARSVQAAGRGSGFGTGD